LAEISWHCMEKPISRLKKFIGGRSEAENKILHTESDANSDSPPHSEPSTGAREYAAPPRT